MSVADQEEHLRLAVQAARGVLAVVVAEDREKAGVDRRLYILGGVSCRSELLQAAEDMAVEHAFAEGRTQDRVCGQAAADDVCMCLDDRIDLQRVEEHTEPLAYLPEPLQLGHHFALRTLMLQVHRNVL